MLLLAFTSIGDATTLEFYEDRGPNSIKSDNWSMKNKKLRDTMIQEHESDFYASVDDGVEKSKNCVAVNECSSEAALSTGISTHNFPTGVELNKGKVSHEGVEAFKTSPELHDVATSVPEEIDVRTIPAEQEVCLD